MILSSELEATLAPAILSSLAFAKTSLLSIPSFFAISYMRTGIIAFFHPTDQPSLHKRTTLEMAAVFFILKTLLHCCRGFPNLKHSTIGFSASCLKNGGSAVTNFRNFG